MWTNGFFKCLLSFALDPDIRTVMRLKSYEFKSSYISCIYNPRKRIFLKFLLQESISWGSKGCVYIIRAIISHQKDPEHIRRTICPEGFDQKADIQKDDLHEVPDSQCLLCMIHGSFIKVKIEMTRSKRSADNSEKLVDPNGWFPLWWCTYLLRKKATHFFLQS